MSYIVLCILIRLNNISIYILNMEKKGSNKKRNKKQFYKQQF